MKPDNVKRPIFSPGGQNALSAGGFRRILDDFAKTCSGGGSGMAEHQIEEVRALIEHHVVDPAWRERLHVAREAALRGERDVLLLRFSSARCMDGGRAINVGDANWPETLTDDAADLYQAAHNELEGDGFRLTARILDYPHGSLGNAGLFLSWPADA
jgi:hypothetical protein